MNLSAVVRLTGVNEHTLRAWERRYSAITPLRDEHGWRFYTTKEVEKIQLLSALVKEGHSIGLIAQLSPQRLKAMLEKSLSPEATIIRSEESKARHFSSNIIEALKNFNLENLHHNLQRARFEMTTKEIVVDLIRPLMHEVGRMSEVGKLSIFQEHLLSSLLRDYLGNIHQSLTPYDFASRKNSKIVVLTTREGDLHEFNVLMAAILSNVYKFQTYYLGPNMPVEDLMIGCQRLKADFLVLGFTYLPPDREVITPEKYLTQLDRNLPRNVTFCLGGGGEHVAKNISKDRNVVKLNGLDDLDRFFADQSIL